MIDFQYGVELDTIRGYDVEYLRKCRNNPLVHNWCRQVGLIDTISQDSWMQRISDDIKIRMYTIQHEKAFEDHGTSYHTIGLCGFTGITPTHNTAEFSIYIDPDCQKKGYATAALKTLIRHGFEDLNFNRIWGETFDANPGIKLYEKLGFKKEGTLRETYYKQGNYINSHIYSILKKDFIH